MHIAKQMVTAAATCLLVTSLMQPGRVFAQQKLSAEDEAMYREMVKRAGLNTSTASDVKKANEAAQNWGSAKLVRYHIVGMYQGMPNLSSDPGKGSGFASVTD